MDAGNLALSDQIVEKPPFGYQQYETVTVNIWLTRGIHHFIQCDETIDRDPDLDGEDWSDDDGLPVLCDVDDTGGTYYPVRRNAPKYDNVKFYVRPLDCEEARLFSRLYDREAFWDHCVDKEVG